MQVNHALTILKIGLKRKNLLIYWKYYTQQEIIISWLKISIDRFLKNFYCSQVMSYLCQKSKKMGVTAFFPETKRVENFPDLVHVSQHDPQGFIAKNIEAVNGSKQS